MSRERYRLYLRRNQLVDDGVDVVVQCTGNNVAEYVPGTADQTWYEFTELTDGLEQLSLSWDHVNTGSAGESTETNPGGSNYDKGISLELTFRDEAYQFIDAWLLADPCSILNSIDVRLEDALCARTYRLFELKADNLTYAPFDAPCEVTARLREADPVWHCVHKTFIWDNWQDWFIDGSTKQHPTFLVCVEPRPRIVASARMALSIFGQTIPVVSALFNENDNVFRRILGVDNFGEAPLVRDYISNVADKCGLTVDTLFHDPASPYYNLCLFYPAAGQYHVNDGSSITSPALWFHLANRWIITLADLLDKLRPVFGAEWYVTPNDELVFQNKTSFLNVAPIYDFTAAGALPIWELVYEFDGTKKPAYGRYQYTLDASDEAAREVSTMYNDIVDFDGPANNPMLEGNLTRSLEFAPTGFVRDGRAKTDYMREIINDGETGAYALLILLAVIIAALLAGVLSAGAAAALAAFLGIWAASIASKANDLRTTFGASVYTGAVRMTAEQPAVPRLLLWDVVAMNRAKVVQTTPAAIVPDPYYNPDADTYATRNPFRYAPVGGQFVINYPMYFDSQFEDNLFDRFHEALDNPLVSLDTHQTFTFHTDLCCEILDVLGVWEGQFARIGALILIEHRATYDVYGRLEHFEVDASTDRVRLRGTVIKLTPQSSSS